MFRISPFDAGTGRIESLSGFSIRYAEHMAVSFIDFYRSFIFPAVFHESTRVSRVAIPSGTVIDGITKTALDWTRALEKVTSVANLSGCTLLPFAGVVAARRLVTSSRRWCPPCLEEMADRGRNAVFEPLVWRLEEGKFCSRHKLPLISTCPKCQKGGQYPFVANARVGCCRHCGAWLGTVCDGEHASPTEFDAFVAEQCEELLQLVAQMPAGSHLLPSNVVVQALRDVFFHGNAAEMARAVGELAGQANGYVSGEFPAPLHFFMRAAFVTGASMHQMFVTNEFAPGERIRAEHTFEVRRARSTHLCKQAIIDDALRAALVGDGSKSVQAIAVDLCMEPVTVWRRSPDLSSQVSRHHASYVAATAAVRRAAFESRVEGILLSFKSRGVRPTDNELKEALDDPACFLNDWKRAVIRLQFLKLDL